MDRRTYYVECMSMLFKYLPDLILRQNKDLCPSQCMQSAFRIQEYLLLKVHVVEYVHKLLVLGGYFCCGEQYPLRLPKNLDTLSGSQSKLLFCVYNTKHLGSKRGRWQARRHAKKHRVQMAACSLNCFQGKYADLLRFHVSRLSKPNYFLFYIHHIMLLIPFLFCFVFIWHSFILLHPSD